MAQGVKISFGMIVFNGRSIMAPHLLEVCIEHVLPYAHEIIIVDGLVNAWKHMSEKVGSDDGTIELIQKMQCSNPKIKLIRTDRNWVNKTEMCNAYAAVATGDYVWQLDSDEFYKDEDFERIIKILNTQHPFMMSFKAEHFWGGWRSRISRSTEHLWGNDYPWNRLFRHSPGRSRWLTHEPPVYEYEPGVVCNRQQNVISYDAGRMWHFAYVTRSQVRYKCEAYNGIDYNQAWLRWRLDQHAATIILGTHTEELPEGETLPAIVEKKCVPFYNPEHDKPLVSFIIAYSEADDVERRKKNLRLCIKNIRETYSGRPDLDIEIIVAEQPAGEPFKRGQLFNLGYKVSRGEVIVTQDVDVRYDKPLDILRLLAEHDRPIIPWTERVQVEEDDNGVLTKLESNIPAQAYGGVNLYTKHQFKHACGYSNLYVQWGAEDAAMHVRANHARIEGRLFHVKHTKNCCEQSRQNHAILAGEKLRDKEQDGFRQTTAAFHTTLCDDGVVRHIVFHKIGTAVRYAYESARSDPSVIPCALFAARCTAAISASLMSLKNVINLALLHGNIPAFHLGNVRDERFIPGKTVDDFLRAVPEFIPRAGRESAFVLPLFMRDTMLSNQWWQYAEAAVQEINRSGIDWSVLIVDTLPMVKFGICRRVDLQINADHPLCLINLRALREWVSMGRHDQFIQWCARYAQTKRVPCEQV